MQPNTVLNEFELSTPLPFDDFGGTAAATPNATATAATTTATTATATATTAGESEFHIESTTHRTNSSKVKSRNRN